MDTDNSMVIAGIRVGGEIEGGYGRYLMMEWRLIFGGEHTIQCTDDVF